MSDPLGDCPLVVDLDGALLRSDILAESVLTLIRTNPLAIFLLPAWLARGKTFLAGRLAERVRLDVAGLPYHENFLAFLQGEAACGRHLLLATAAPVALARQIAEYLGCFQAVVAAEGSTAAGKIQAILRACGNGPFDYAGRCAADLPLWRRARQAILVSPARRLAAALGRPAASCRIFPNSGGGWMAFLRAARVQQWLKNLLIFLPLVTRQEWRHPEQVVAAGIGFLAFSLAASTIYLLNDLLDLPADRRHPVKRNRPLAAGEVSLRQGGVLMHLLLAGALGLTALLPGPFLGVLLVYLGVTAAYSLYLKKVVMVDVVTLAGLYTLRVVAGSAAIDVAPSFWLLAFSMFIFLSLALVKRYSEVAALSAGLESARGRDYRRADLVNIYSLGTASGYLSILVLALFINSPELARDYDHPEALWLLCPVLLYWVSRVWIMAGRGEVQEDPLIFAMRDRVSRLILGASAAIVFLAQ